MARKPEGHVWPSTIPAEAHPLLDRVDFYGNNAWDKTSALVSTTMPKLLGELADMSVPVTAVQEAMAEIGYSPEAVHQVARWDSTRRTGKLGP